MGPFELERGHDRKQEQEDVNAEALAAVRGDSRRIKQECIIALKVYDHCRQPDCKIQYKMG